MILTNKHLDKNRKLLLDSKSPALIQDIIDQARILCKGYEYHDCDTIEDCIPVLTSVNIFGDAPRLVVLRSMQSEGLVALSVVSLEEGDVLLISDDGSLSRLKDYTHLRSLCTILKLEEPGEDSCAARARKKLTDAGVSFSEDVPRFLVSRVGTDISAIDNELQKLICLAGSGNLDSSVVARVIPERGEVAFFKMSEMFFRRRITEFVEAMGRLPEGEHVRFLHFLIEQVYRIYQAASYREQRLSDDDAAQLMGVPTFILRTKIYPAAMSFGIPKLLRVMDLLNQLDVEMRSTKYDKRLVYEVRFLKAIRT